MAVETIAITKPILQVQDDVRDRSINFDDNLVFIPNYITGPEKLPTIRSLISSCLILMTTVLEGTIYL